MQLDRPRRLLLVIQHVEWWHGSLPTTPTRTSPPASSCTRLARVWEGGAPRVPRPGHHRRPNPTTLHSHFQRHRHRSLGTTEGMATFRCPSRPPSATSASAAPSPAPAPAATTSPRKTSVTANKLWGTFVRESEFLAPFPKDPLILNEFASVTFAHLQPCQ